MKNYVLKSTILLVLFLFSVSISSDLIAQTLNSTTGHLNLRSQNIYGNNASAFYLKSNNSTNIQLLLRDKENKVYGRLYGGGNGASFGLMDGDGHWSYLAAKDNYTSFRINNSEKMRILTNGNIGIGTTNPTYKLSVNGKIRAKEVIVETGWSDFVFEKNYNLPTLKEVEIHIKKKGHLKDIPSAKEVAENGISLGEMDSKLLQKIEELTLYTIEQEKKIKSLEKQNSRIEKLEKENEFLKTMSLKLLELQKRMEQLEKE